MAKKLSEAEINKRLVRLTNLERLHVQDQQTKADLRARVKQLEQALIDQRAYFEAIIETQAAQITELQTMVYGRKKRPPSGGNKQSPTKPRDPDFYRRAKPSEESVTSEGPSHH